MHAAHRAVLWTSPSVQKRARARQVLPGARQAHTLPTQPRLWASDTYSGLWWLFSRPVVSDSL